MKKIIIDTNFLMIPWQFKVDIFSEIDRICNFNYKLCIFRQSLGELKNIVEKQKGKSKKAAQFALKLIEKKGIEILEADGRSVDSIILENADKHAITATSDRLLKNKLLSQGRPVIILRQKKYLQLIKNF